MPLTVVALVLCACDDDPPTLIHACTGEACDGGGLAPDLRVTVLDVTFAPPSDDAGVPGTALIVLHDTASGEDVPVADVRPRFVALAPGREATSSAGVERTDARGLIPVSFKAACFPFDILVRTPDARSATARIAPEGGAERFPCE